MQDAIVPAHVFYDPRIIGHDLISEMIATIVSDPEIRKTVEFKMVSMSAVEIVSGNPLPSEKAYRIDLRLALETLISDYKSWDKMGIGTRDREVLILLGSFPMDDWLDGGEEIPSYLPQIITYWLDKEGLSGSNARQDIDRLLSRISPADPVTHKPRHKIVEFKDQNLRTSLQDIFGKFKSRLLEKVRAQPSAVKKG